MSHIVTAATKCNPYLKSRPLTHDPTPYTSALVDAASAFEQIYKDAMLGKGADSHLRALREAALVTGGGQGRMAGHIEELMASRDGDCRLETRVVPVQISAASSTDRVMTPIIDLHLPFC